MKFSEDTPEFWLWPWDRPRPRRYPPLADGVLDSEGKTYFWRAHHGLIFCRDAARNDPEFTLTAGEPLNGDANPVHTLRDALESGNIARYVLLNHRDHHRRDIPLFFRPNGTGFCRESWNRDDVHFQHDLSLHDWLEAPASALQNAAREVFQQEVVPQLSKLPWPSDRNWPLSFHGGTREELSDLVAAIVALEPPLREGGKIIRVSCQAESPFSRAGVYAVTATGGTVRTFFDESTGERVLNEYWTPTLTLTERFWTLCDWAVDAITPGGIYWDILDRGRGRLSESPHARDFSLQFIVSKLPKPQDALSRVRNWATQSWSEAEVDKVLQYEAVPDFPVREEF